MRARIYKLEDGTTDIFIEPAPGKGLPPVLLRQVTSEDVVARVLPEIQKMRLPRPLPPAGTHLA